MPVQSERLHQLLSNTQQTLGLLWLLPKQVCLSQVSYSQDTTSKEARKLLSMQFSGM